jgi:hypothetical protein
MRSSLAFPILLALAGGCHAGEIRNGAAMRVKADSIWFQDAATLKRWQALKKSGDTAALASYQDGMLKGRHAWQFLKSQEVRIRGTRPNVRRVDVEMIAAGRMQGTTWMLDADALQR